MYKPYARWQTETLLKALSKRRVLVLAGPRQCGKTTLVKSLAAPNIIYRTLDDQTLLNAALSDPRGFVRHGDELMVIDEVQRAPVLLQAIKQDVDENQKPGRFLLTGSANIQSLPNVTESLAGRVSRVRLRPLVLGEIFGSKPHFLESAFRQEFHPKVYEKTDGGYQHYDDKDAYLSEAFRGGFPEARLFDEDSDRNAWHRDYIRSLIERDLKDIANIKRKDSMNKLLEVLAAWSSKYMDVSSICKSLSITRPTVESYINALETLYLVERVGQWHKTDYDRVGKQERLFMTDTGMMTALLKWRFDKVRLDGDMNGKLIETFVFNQLSALLDINEDKYSLTHYRDREKREVDFVVENKDGAVLGIEVKSASIVDKKMFKHIIWFRDNIVPKKDFVGIVMYTGEHVVPFGENLWAVPINCLWA